MRNVRSRYIKINDERCRITPISNPSRKCKIHRVITRKREIAETKTICNLPIFLCNIYLFIPFEFILVYLSLVKPVDIWKLDKPNKSRNLAFYESRM